MNKDNLERYRAPALDKGLDIIELLAESPTGLTQAEIAKGLGRRSNEIYRMLDTLVRRSYVSKVNNIDRYILTLRMLVLANKQPSRRRLLDIAEPAMRILALNAEQSCHLALHENGDIVVASSFSAPGNWRLSLRVGSQIGIYNTGSGLVLVAFQSDKIRSIMLREHSLVVGEEKLNDNELKNKIDNILKLGYACEESQTVKGTINLSYPILDPFGNAIASLTCPYIQRIDDHKSPSLEQVSNMFARATAEIGRKINGT